MGSRRQCSKGRQVGTAPYNCPAKNQPDQSTGWVRTQVEMREAHLAENSPQSYKLLATSGQPKEVPSHVRAKTRDSLSGESEDQRKRSSSHQ